MPSKCLILRLSSLGDVILACAALEVKSLQPPVDWVIAPEYSSLLKNHPKIGKVIEFDRKAGFKAWVRLGRELWESQYDQVYDLHRSWRTRILWVLFIFWNLKSGRPRQKWNSYAKQRMRFYLYFILKKFLPRKFRPAPVVVRFAKAVGGQGGERPNLRQWVPTLTPGQLAFSSPSNYLCIMPGSRWEGKKWPISKYLEVIQKTGVFPVVLGAHSDLESQGLVALLAEKSIPHLSGVGKWTLPETASILAYSRGYLGGDTGLAHLAEAVGVPAVIIFGPTVPDMGFGPWGMKSQAIGFSLWCRPCGKDGRFCFRRAQKFKCIRELSSQRVLESFYLDENQPSLRV